VKKEVFSALLVGFFIGSTIAIFAVKLPNWLSQKTSTKKTIPASTPVPSSIINLSKSALVINKPEDQSIFSQPFITLEGNSKENSLIIIESEKESLIAEADKNGSFSAKLNLIEGGNPIYITSEDNSSEPETKILTIFYTPEKL